MDSLPSVGLLRVDHVGIAVADLDEAIAFYARAFGMRCVHQETNSEQGVREAMLAAGDGGTCARIPRSRGSSIAAAPVCSSSPTPWPTSRRAVPLYAPAVYDCCTTSRGGAPPGRGSTSCTRRTPAAFWWS